MQLRQGGREGGRGDKQEREGREKVPCRSGREAGGQHKA